MSDQVKISKNEKTDITFEVAIEGVEQHKNLPVSVRFVIEKVQDEYDIVFPCVQSPVEKTWSVEFPPMKDLSKDSYSFHVEVIVDNYFFEAAAGRVAVVDHVEEEKEEKPEVSVSIKDENEKKEEPKDEKDVKEDYAPATTVPGPNNALLVPEKDPADPKPQKQSTDSKIDLKKLFSFASKTTPGTSSAELPAIDEKEPQDTKIIIKKEVKIKKETPTEESAMPAFDAKQAAQDIIKERIGHIAKPTVRGTLLKRSSTTGKPIIPGLIEEDAASIQSRVDKQQKTREALKDILPN